MRSQILPVPFAGLPRALMNATSVLPGTDSIRLTVRKQAAKVGCVDSLARSTEKRSRRAGTALQDAVASLETSAPLLSAKAGISLANYGNPAFLHH